MKTLQFTLLGLVLAFISLNSQTTANIPKNIIVFISDGCSYNHIAATKYYHGKDSNSYEKFAVHYPMSTYSSSTNKMWEDTIDGYNSGYNSFLAWTDWKWMQREGYGGSAATGSGAAATTMATGVKSMKYAIGVDIDSNLLETITERAITLGKSAGVVSSVQISHATPAGFSAHNNSRKENAAIAKNQTIDSKLSVLMGCGHPYFDKNGDSISDSQQFNLHCSCI